MPDAYADILKNTQALEDFMEPTPLAVDIVLLGQLKANIDIDDDAVKPARKLFVSIFEPGAHFDGEVLACSATGIALNAKPGASQEEIDTLAEAANKALGNFTDVCVYVVSKDISGKATLAFNKVVGVSAGTELSRSQADTDVAREVVLSALTAKGSTSVSKTPSVPLHKEDNRPNLDVCLSKNTQGDVIIADSTVIGQVIQLPDSIQKIELKTCSNLPSLNVHYQTRKKHSEAIIKHLSEHARGVIKQEASVCGAGGIGKTQLVAALCSYACRQVCVYPLCTCRIAHFIT